MARYKKITKAAGKTRTNTPIVAEDAAGNGQTMASHFRLINQNWESIAKLCKPDSYNLVLHKHLGDVFYAIAAKDEFEREYGAKLRFIVRPQHEFLLQMYGIEDYSVYDLDALVKKNQLLKNVYFHGSQVDSRAADCFENDFFQALFQCVPVKGQPFICENLINHFLAYPRFWSYRWAANMGLKEDFRFPLPKHTPTLSSEAQKKLSAIAPLDRIVLFAPEAATASELAPEFWNIIADKVHEHGYKVIVNSKKYVINHGISAFDLDLSLSDVVALGLSCAYVFSLRSGLCDVLVGARERLYTFYPAMLHREMWSINKCFEPIPNVHEISLWHWQIDQVIWERDDLTPALQKYVNSLRANFWAERLRSVSHLPWRKHRHGHQFWYRLFRDIAGKSKLFAENNIQNHHHRYAWDEKISFLGLPLYTRKHSTGSGNKWTVRHSILGGLLRYKRSDDHYKISLLGIQLLTHSVDANKVLYIRFPRRRANQRWLNRLQSLIPQHHDDIYILRHNIGESYVELMHLAQTIKVNQSKRPLLIVWDQKNVPFYKMFRHQNLEMRYVSLNQNDIHRVFDDKTMIQRGHQRFFCSTPWVAENMKKQLETDDKVNFYHYIKAQSGVWNDAAPLLPEPSAEVKAQVEQKIQRYELGDKFLILAPEANSLVEMSQSFWSKLACCLHAKGYRLFLNAWENDRMHVPHTVAAKLSIAEIFAMAQKSSGVITMASGLAVLLTAAGSKMDLLYTDFSRESTGYDSALAKKIYSVSHLPGFSAEKIIEHDTNQFQEQELLNLILNRY